MANVISSATSSVKKAFSGAGVLGKIMIILAGLMIIYFLIIYFPLFIIWLLGAIVSIITSILAFVVSLVFSWQLWLIVIVIAAIYLFLKRRPK